MEAGGIRAIALQTPRRKPRRKAASGHVLASFLASDRWVFSTPISLENALERRLGRGARHFVPGDEQPADQRPWQAGAGASPGEGRNNSGDGQQRHELDRDDGGKWHEAWVGQRIDQLPR